MFDKRSHTAAASDGVKEMWPAADANRALVGRLEVRLHKEVCEACKHNWPEIWGKYFLPNSEGSKQQWLPHLMILDDSINLNLIE